MVGVVLLFLILLAAPGAQSDAPVFLEGSGLALIEVEWAPRDGVDPATPESATR